MSKARVAVLTVITKELTVTAAALEYGYSRRHLHRLLARYKAAGLDAVEPRSRRPHSNSAATSQLVRDQIVELRLQLTRDGLDAGPMTIAWHLEQARPPGPLDIHDQTDPAQRRADHPRTPQEATVLLPTLRSRTAQRMLAIRLHPLAPGRRHRHGDPQLAR